MVLIDIKRPHAVPLFDPLTHLVYSAGKSDVRHVFLAGEQVVRDGAADPAVARGHAGRRRGRWCPAIEAGGGLEGDSPDRTARPTAARRRPRHRSRNAHGAPCEIALVLGTGLGELADAVSGRRRSSPMTEIAGFPVSTAPGHKGRLVIGSLFGRRSVVMQGRLHLYEGWHPRDIALAVYLLTRLGAATFIVTNAAGGLNADFAAGDIMLIDDHLNFTGTSPLIGANDDALGLRFPDQSRLYDPDLAELAMASARRTGTQHVARHLCRLNGPELETSAERRYFRTAGGDAVGDVDRDRSDRRQSRRDEGARALGRRQCRHGWRRPAARHGRIGHSDGRLVRRQDCRGACRSVAETAGRDLSFPGRLISQGLRLGATNGFVSVNSVFFV